MRPLIFVMLAALSAPTFASDCDAEQLAARGRAAIDQLRGEQALGLLPPVEAVGERTPASFKHLITDTRGAELVSYSLYPTDAVCDGANAAVLTTPVVAVLTRDRTGFVEEGRLTQRWTRSGGEWRAETVQHQQDHVAIYPQ